jgi:hypothetical protein
VAFADDLAQRSRDLVAADDLTTERRLADWAHRGVAGLAQTLPAKG